MSLWDTILKDAGGQGVAQQEGEATGSGEGSGSSSPLQQRGVPHKQVLIVGPYYAGKRTLAARLRESAGDKRGTSKAADEEDVSPSRGAVSGGTSSSRSGGGIDHSFVDVRSDEGHVLATVELFVLDSIGVIPVILSNLKACQNAMVIFAVDLSAPSTSLDSFDQWVTALNTHVTKVAEEAGPGGYEELRGLRIKEWATNSGAFVQNRQRAYDSVKARAGSGDGDAQGMPSNTVVLDPTAVCLLPSMVVGSKLDQYEKYCRGKQDPAHSEIGTMAYGIEVLRKKSLDMRSGFAALSLLSSAPATQHALKGLWYWCLVECLKIPNVPVPEPAGSSGSAWGADSTLNNNSMAGTGSVGGRTRALSNIGNKPSADSLSSPNELPSVGYTIWQFVEPLICYEVEDSSVFVPQGSDLYELLSGFVRTSDGVQSWSSFFPPATLKRPKISSHTETLNNLKDKLTSDDPAEGDMWDL